MPAAPDAHRPTRAIFTRIIAGLDENGDFGPLVSKFVGPIFVEDRLIGTYPVPSSGMVHEIQVLQQGPGNDGIRSGRGRYFAQDWFPRPVDPRRWPAVRPAALARARDEGKPLAEVMVDATVAALALINLEDAKTSPERSFEQEARRLINDLVTTDFLGPDWRHDLETDRADAPRETHWADVEDLGAAAVDDTVLAAEDRRALIARAKLSPQEQAVLTAVVDEGWSVAEWARTQGIAASGARTALMRARQKLRKASDEG
ncbi:MAG: RNA polymerase sigma factor [Gemmatimonadaceae bacterium]